MKWNNLSAAQKIFFVIGCICGIVYLVLSFPALRSYLAILKAALYPLYGFFWLCMGISSINRKWAIMCYVLGAGWLLLSLLHFFF